MKGLLEKIKSLDKKILIGAGAGIVALIVAIVVILVVCLGGKDKEVDKDNDKDKTTYEQNDDKDKEDKDKEDEKEATFTVKVVDADGAAVAGVVVQVCKDECVPATTDETGVATFKLEITEGYKLSVVSCPEGYEYTGGEVALTAGITEYELKIQKKAEGTDGGNGGGQTATQQPTTVTQDGEEIIGDGSRSNPYTLMPKSDRVYKTLSIPAGSKSYYAISRVGNSIFTINDTNAYVIESNGTRHNASGGKVSFTVEDALASDYVLFQIGNNSSFAKSFTIIFSDPTGSQDNPTVLNTLGNGSKVTIKLSAGDADGYCYKYIAEKSGTIRFYMEATIKSSFSAQNNSTPGTINRTLLSVAETEDEKDIDLDNCVKTDENGKRYIELEKVTKGDEIEIKMGAMPNNRGKFQETTITWCGKYN